jgi:hypothetical protein
MGNSGDTGKGRFHSEFGLVKRRAHSGDLSEDGKIILKLMLWK